MSEYKEVIFDLETGLTSERLFNAEEIKQAKIDEAKMKELDALIAQAEATKTTAQAKLTALGLTVDELKALGLGNN
jgi:hypothetical protein